MYAYTAYKLHPSTIVWLYCLLRICPHEPYIFENCLLPFAFFFFFTRIGIPSTRNQWIRSPKPHLFKTAQSGLRPGPFARIWVKRYVVSKVPRFVWTRPQFTYYLIYHCRFFHLLCTRHYTSMCMNPRYSGKRNWRHRNGNQWYIHPSLKRKIT